jgi:hypothetical protein
MRLDAEGEIAQHLRAKAISQADILETDHAPSGSAAGPPPARSENATFTALRRTSQWPQAPKEQDIQGVFMVSDPLTDRC